MVSRTYSFLGLIQKSGKLVSGADAVELEIKKKRCVLLIISEDASENTRRRFERLVELHKLDYVNFGTQAELGEAIGKRDRSVLAICDTSLAKGFLSKIYRSES
jgi:ribosomal protein L7Ae-like RNA K-turn-binding protein